MAISGYTGISFPFRVNENGGVAMTTTGINDPSHIEESIRQILTTYELERPMEHEVYSALEDFVFEPNDESLQSMIKSVIIDTLECLEDRIELDEDDIEFELEEGDGISIIYTIITYKIIKYETYYTSQIKLGEVIA